MLKKMICACLAAVTLTAAGGHVLAAEAEGEILVWLRDGERFVRSGSVEIYRAGDPVPEGYLLGEEFGGGIIAGEDIPSPEFARWMSEKAGPGRIRLPDRDGLVWFTGLEPGMYLIRQGDPAENYRPIEPYLVCVSPELSRIDTYPQLRRAEYIPRTATPAGPYLGALGASAALTGLAFFTVADRKKARR